MRVLIVDDEPNIRRALQAALTSDHFEVVVAASGAEGLDAVASVLPDLVLLDLEMPGITGFDVCKRIRSWSSVPIIVLSVRDSEEDKVQALDLGADDYLTKPFGVGELFARMRALLRRVTDEELQLANSTVKCGELTIDLAARIVLVSGQEVHLTPKEYELLCYMARNPDRVLTPRQLLTKVWGVEFSDQAHTLRVHMANLRNKIEKSPERPVFIHMETRVGYRFRGDG